MKVRQLVQILVFPKSFNVLSFYSKGNYAIRIKLTLENKSDNTFIKAFPILVEGREARKEDDKRSKVNTVHCYYDTERFFVTFSEEKIVFNTACLFKAEYTVGEEYLTYFDFQIIYFSSKRKTTPEQEGQALRAEKVVDKRRIYLNLYNSVNKFKRVLFDDSDYFSHSDVLFIAQSFGEKIRLRDYQFLEFFNSDIQTREKQTSYAFERWISMKNSERKHLLKQYFGLPVEQFYIKMLWEKVVRYRKLCQTYQKYRFLMETMNNSTMSGSLYTDHMQWIKVQQHKSVQTLMDQYQTDDISQLYMLIYQQSHEIIRNIKYIWQQLISLLISINFNLIDEISSREIEEERKTRNKWLLTYSDIVNDQLQKERGKFMSKRAEIIKKMDMYEDHDLHHPFLIIENFTPPETSTRKGIQIDSLVVMIHGYQGSSVDLQKARNFMNMYNPNCHGLLIKTIEDEIDNPLEVLGETVGEQIRLHMIKTLNNYKRINFIGYSLGGVIARASLKHLQRYKHLMNVFISFASPHAGICDASNPLVSMGIWFLTNFQKNKNLKQLNCQPDPESSQISLISLSDCDAIGWFKRFVAVSSKEDGFVPYESSRLDEKSMGEMTKSICLNLKKKIKRLERVDVWFDINHISGTFDKMTGRRSHIQFLQNRMFLDSFFATYGELL